MEYNELHMGEELTQEQVFTAAAAIINWLMEKKELQEKDNPELFNSYYNAKVRNGCDIISEGLKFKIQYINGTLYYIPTKENRVFVYTRSELQYNMMPNSGLIDYYVINFIILNIMTMFYSSSYGDSAKMRFQLDLGHLEKNISEMLEKMPPEAEIMPSGLEENEGESVGLCMGEIRKKWATLKPFEPTNGDKTTKKKEYRRGYIQRTVDFLEKQGLLVYRTEDANILTTKKMDDFMAAIILPKENFQEKEAYLNAIILKSQEKREEAENE